MTYKPNSNQTQDDVYVADQVAISGGVRRDADTSPVTTDGDVHPFVFEETGRLKVSSYAPSIPVYTDTITSNGDTVVMDVTRFSNLVITCRGTFSTVNVIFEVSNNNQASWVNLQGARSNANTVEGTSGNLSAAPAYSWEFSVNGYSHFRVRATAFTSGTQTWDFQAGAYATEPVPAIQVTATQPVSGTVTATIAAAAATIAKAEDAVAASGDTGVFNLGVRRDGAITTAPASGAGDYSEMAVDNYGQTRIAVHGRTTNPTAAADGNGVVLLADKLGKQVVVGSIRDLKDNQRTTITSSTSETTIVTAVASTFMDLYGLLITNTSATACNVTIKDATAGTTRFVFAVPAGQTVGFTLPESAAHKQAVVNTNWTATCSASVASIEITALTVRNI